MAILSEDRYRAMRGGADLVLEMSQEVSSSSLQKSWMREKGPPVSEKVCSSAQVTYARLKTEPKGRVGVDGHAAAVQNGYSPHLSAQWSRFYLSNL